MKTSYIRLVIIERNVRESNRCFHDGFSSSAHFDSNCPDPGLCLQFHCRQSFANAAYFQAQIFKILTTLAMLSSVGPTRPVT
jgi:hypothetical protein